MGKRSTKSTKKFITSGKLQKTIQQRKKHQQIRKQIQGRRGAHNGKSRVGHVSEDGSGDDDDDEEVKVESKSKGKGKGKAKGVQSVDDFLNAGFMDEDGDEDEDEEGGEDVDMELGGDEDDSASDLDGDEDGDEDENASFGSLDDFEDEGHNHLLELSKLAEKDPEFYKYLQENDRELLEFNVDADAEEDEGEDAPMQDTRPILTLDILRGWQKSILEKRSLRSLRKLLVAYRSAVYMNDEDVDVAWSIDNSSVYNKLITTTLRYVPIVLEHHAPYKRLPNDKFKPPTQTPKLKALQKPILTYFHNTIHLLTQLSDPEMLKLTLSQSSKIVPYIVTSRKTVKVYLKTCLSIWSSSPHEPVRVAAFLCIRNLATAAEESTLDTVLKGTYLTLVRSSKATTGYTMPLINLMKNTAVEVFVVDAGATYQHAFGYVRQLAIHLRNSMKAKTKESYKQVYNWQFVHSFDFWVIVLARTCSACGDGRSGDLKQLIYPLVQVGLGAIKLMSNSRLYPFHFHMIRSLVHLSRHTEVYIPLAPYILPILTSTIGSSQKQKQKPKSKSGGATLKPLDFEIQIRAPEQYVKTRTYGDGLIEEAVYLLGEWLVCPSVHGSIGFPEIVLPVMMALRKALKGAKGGKELGGVKMLIERTEESAKWVEGRRKNVELAPSRVDEVKEWEVELRGMSSEWPLARYMKVQGKAREKRLRLLEKARKGEDEILSE